MINENFFDVLENCFKSIEEGSDVESCLARYPGMADELRPALMAAYELRFVPAATVSPAVMQRGRTKVLQAAAEMRSLQMNAPTIPVTSANAFSAPPLSLGKKGFWQTRFFRMAATASAVIIFLLTSGTGLVSASSNSLPGDHLYPVKRSYEDVRMFFAFSPQSKIQLEQQYEVERVQEIEELYVDKRTAPVTFQGTIQSQGNGVWVVNGLNVTVHPETSVSGEMHTGSTVQVVGETEDGVVKANRLILIPSTSTQSDQQLNPTQDATNTNTPEPSDTSQSGNNEGAYSTNTQQSSDNQGSSDSPNPTYNGDQSGDNHNNQGWMDTPTPTSESGWGSNATPRPTSGESSSDGGHPRSTESEKRPTRTPTPGK